MSARSIFPTRSAAVASISAWAVVSSRSATQVSTLSAPRVSRSWATAVRRFLWRPTSMKREFFAAIRRIVAMAMLEVAPKTSTAEGKRGSRLVKASYPLPEAGAERGIDVGSELLPLRIKVVEVGRAHAGIFSWIHSATELGRYIRQLIEQVEAHLAPDGEIQRQGDAWHGEGHHAGGLHIAEDLDDGEERSQPRCSNRLECLDHAHGIAFPGQNALELKQPLLAIEPVPLEDAVERVEKGLVIDQAGLLFAHLLVVVEGVDGTHGKAAKGNGRQVEGHGDLRLDQRCERTLV